MKTKLSVVAALTVVQVDAAGGRGQELVQRHWGGRLGRGGGSGGGAAHLLSVGACATLRVMFGAIHALWFIRATL